MSFGYDYVQPKYDKKYDFLVYRETDGIYKNIVEDVDSRSDASICELDRPFSRGKYKNVIGLMKDYVE